jgi:methylmalonyl-CoA mutase N-terminal domain/subunit
MDEIEARGGMVRALEEGFVQRRIAERAFEYQRALDGGEVPVVGVNKFKSAAPPEEVEIHRNDPVAERQKVDELNALRARRDKAEVEAALARLESAARGTGNLMEPIRAAVSAYATVGEMADRLRRVFGAYQPPSGF